jgi:hypothetical protein
LSLAFRILSALYKLSRFLECLVLGGGLVSHSYIYGHLWSGLANCAVRAFKIHILSISG